MESDDLGTDVTADYIRLKIWGKKQKPIKQTNKQKTTLNIWNQIGVVRDGFSQKKKMMAGFQNDFQGKKMTRYS